MGWLSTRPDEQPPLVAALSGNGSGPVWRASENGEDSFVLNVSRNSSTVTVYQKTSGAYSVVGTYPATTTESHSFRIDTQGATPRIYQGSASVCTFTSSHQQTATRVGLRITDTVSRASIVQVSSN